MEKINQELLSLARGNEEYARFNKRIVNTSKQVYGVRLPDMRKLAKSLAKDFELSDMSDLFDKIDANIFEHVMLIGLVISYSNISNTEKILLTRKYLELVDSWALVDSFVAKMKKFDERLYWNFALECLGSTAEFTARYGIIMLMSNYLRSGYIDKVFDALRSVRHDGYYVKMAAAWLYATAAVEFYDKTLHELESPEIDTWTKQKAYQKMLESYRFSDGQKQSIRKIKTAVA